MRPSPLCSAVVCLLLLACMAVTARAELKVAADAVGPAVSQTTSTFAFAQGKDDKASIDFFHSTDDAAPFATCEIGPKPLSLVAKSFKGTSFFAVTCRGDFTIRVIDEKSTKEVARIKIDKDVGYLAIDPRDDSPYIYYTTIPGIRSKEGLKPVMGRINLQTLKDEGWLETPGTLEDATSPFAICISDDGQWAFLWIPVRKDGRVHRVRLNTAADGAAAPRVPNKLYELSGGITPVLDPANRFLAAGSLLRDIERDAPMRHLEGTAAAALQHNATLIAYSNTQILAYSTNDYRLVGSVKADAYFPPPAPPTTAPGAAPFGGATKPSALTQQPYQRPPPRIMETENATINIVPDEVGKRLLVRVGERVSAVPLADLKIAEEPIVAARLPRTIAIEVNKDWAIDVVPQDPRVKMYFKSGPKGMSFENGRLTWKPESDQVGEQQVVLIAAWEKYEINQPMTVIARVPTIRLPFSANQTWLSPDGKLALCAMWGKRDHDGHRNYPEAPDGKLALVDLVSRKVIAERTMNVPMSTCFIDEGHVFVGQEDVAAVHVLSTKDLSDVRDFYTVGRALSMGRVGNLLVIRSQTTTPGDQKKQIEFFAADTLKSVTLTMPPQLPSMMTELIIVDEKYFHYADLEFPLNETKPTGFVFPHGIPMLGKDDEKREEPAFEKEVVIRYFNEARVRANAIVRRRQTPILIPSGEGDAAVMPDLPLWVFLKAENERLRDERTLQERTRIKASLSVRDLRSGKELSVMPILNEALPSGIDDQHIDLQAAPGVLVATLLNNMFVVPTDRFASLPFAQPLALSLKRSPLLVTKNDAIEWDVKGGAGEYRYQLVSPMPGVSIRNDAPIIDIDIQSLQRGVAGAVWDAMPGRSTQRQSSVILKEYLERERPALASGFGIQAQGVPVALRLQIKVSDRENQSVTAIRTVLIDMPESALKDAMEEHDRRRSVDEQERAAVGAAALAGARAPKVDKSPTVMQIRIDELEKENLRLRAQVEILTSLLRNQNGAPAATQPSN